MPLSRTLPALLITAALASCAPGIRTATQSLPPGAGPATVQLAEVKDALDTVSPPPMVMASRAAPMITGLGFAQIAGQPGKTANEKRLMAIRAARMDALRDITEQVHGIRIDASTTIGEAVVTDDSLRGVVAGTIRGAKTLRITPRDGDSYEVQMALDRDTVGYILRALKGGL